MNDEKRADDGYWSLNKKTGQNNGSLCSVVLHGSEIRTLRKGYIRGLEVFEDCVWHRMGRTSCSEHKTKEEKMGEERSPMATVIGRERERKWIGHIILY